MPAEELQAAAEEADAAEEDAEAAAAEEEGGVLEEGGEAEEPSDDKWWRPGRFDGEDCEEWHAGDDSDLGDIVDDYVLAHYFCSTCKVPCMQ
ncbi:unnamed protein product [Closterium sp. NIES-64]|nr:unnamed protein product [Closterium sp. NIES-64]